MISKEPKFISLDKYKMDGHYLESNNKTFSLFWDFDSRTVLFFKNKNLVYDLRNLFFVSTADIANEGSTIIAGAYEKMKKRMVLLYAIIVVKNKYLNILMHEYSM